MNYQPRSDALTRLGQSKCGTRFTAEILIKYLEKRSNFTERQHFHAARRIDQRGSTGLTMNGDDVTAIQFTRSSDALLGL